MHHHFHQNSSGSIQGMGIRNSHPSAKGGYPSNSYKRLSNAVGKVPTV